jgi:N-acetylmuramoyl-L-alanine amidase
MRHPALLTCSLVALAMGAGAASAGELHDLRLVQVDALTRVELRLDPGADVRLFSLQNPDRLVVDLPGTRVAPGLRLPGGNGVVASLRTGQPSPGTLRIVFDLGLPARETHRVQADGAGRLLVVELAGGGDAAGTRNARLDDASDATPLDRITAAFPASQMAASGPTPRRPSAPLAAPAAPVGSFPTALPDPEPTRSDADASDPADAAAPASFADGALDAAPSGAVASAPAPMPRDSDPMPRAIEPSPRDLATPRIVNAPRALAPPRIVPPARVIDAPRLVGPHAPSRTMQDVIGRGQRKLVVAIDAGHGGKDPGAHGPTGVREKHVTLEVARELARQINADPGMRAVLIRDGDSFVPLKQRYMKARAAQADLFISIHADASPNDSATGASVFVLSTRGASSQAARWLADSENAADLVGGVKLDSKDANLAAVLLDLSQSATMRASDDVAGQVLAALKNVGKAHKPAIERANFVVLRSPDVPSMLVETGFITNPDEERRLNDRAYRARLAAAITDGVRRYFVGQPPPGSFFASSDAGSPVTSMASSPQ